MMEEKHWNKVKEALTYYNSQIELFIKEKIKKEGAIEEMFKDLIDELSLIEEGLKIVEKKGAYTSTMGELFARALTRYKNELLRTRKQISEFFPGLRYGTREIDAQLKLIEETMKE